MRATLAIATLLVASATHCGAQSLDSHPRVAAALADLRVAETGRLKSLVAWAPTIAATGEAGYHTIQDTVNGRKDLPITDGGLPGAWSAAITFSQPLIRDTILDEEMAVVDAQIASKRATYLDTKFDVARETIDLDISRHFAGLRLKVVRSTLRQIARVTDASRVRAKSGDTSALDALETRDRSLRWRSQEGAVQSAQASIASRWIKLWGDTPQSGDPGQRLSRYVAPSPERSLGNVLGFQALNVCRSQEACSRAAYDVGPGIAALEQASLQSDAVLERRSRARLPTMSLDGEARHSHAVRGTVDTDEASIQIKGRVPLSWGVEAESDRLQAAAATGVSRARLDLARQDVAGDAAIAYAIRTSSISQLAFLAKRRSVASKLLDATQAAYREGERDARQLMDTIESLAQIDMETLRLQEDGALATLRLERLTGELQASVSHLD